jgi:hypothetical protein
VSRFLTWIFILAGLSACGDGLGAEAPDATGAVVPPIVVDVDAMAAPPACHGVDQTGCEGDEKCAIADDAWSCVAEGEREFGETCREDIGQGDDCFAGLHCYEGTCQELCTSAEPCTDRFSICIPIPSDAELLGICLTTCDPVAQDCQTTSAGDRQGCYLSVSGPVCAPVAESPPLVPGLSCEYLNECAIGSGCVDIDGRSQCAAYCDFDENTNLSDLHCAVMDVCRYLEGGGAAGVCAP